MMKSSLMRITAVFFLALSFTTAVLQSTSAYTYSSPLAETAVHITTSSEAGLSFMVETPPFEMTGDGKLQIAGLETAIQQSGAPALPTYVRYIALPPQAQAIVEVKVVESTEQKVPYVQPAITAVLPNTATSEADWAGTQLVETYTPDPAIYQQNSWYPTTNYDISAPMYHRDLRVVALTLYPVRYNPITGIAVQATQLEVSISFEGANWADLRPSPTDGDLYFKGLEPVLLNPQQALAWRSLPPDVIHAPATDLPIGVDTYKIEIDQTGIYEITYEDLETAGMNVTAVNPNTFEMMYRGETVAYQFIGDSDTTFEPDEKIRFYGWAFDGPRLEKQFIHHNVFWLWAGGTATHIESITNLAGGLPVVTTAQASITAEPEINFFSTWTDKWDDFPNEPDAWYWDYVSQSTAHITKTYPITLPHPVTTTTANALYTVELMSREAPASPAIYSYTVRTSLNNYPQFGELTWDAGQNVNITHTVPMSDLLNGLNGAVVVYATDLMGSGVSARVYLNRVTVEYLRWLIAQDDQLGFKAPANGLQEFHIAGFNENDASDILAWKLDDSLNPTAIEMNSQNIIGTGTYTYTIGGNFFVNRNLFVTTADNVLTSTVFSLTQYIPSPLDPPTDQAEWIAISHADFITQANQLAAHRAQETYGGFSTFVVDVADVINQYGYGLPMPEAIRNYLTYALGNWQTAPNYVVLMGDATLNPRHLNCLAGCFAWSTTAPTYVVTDMVFKDRFQGIVPSDHTMVLLSGDDLLADMAIGRIPANTQDEATAVINKIILYELNLFEEQPWMDELLFVADNADSGGDFCAENSLTGDVIPPNYTQTHLCLPSNTITDTDALRSQMQVTSENIFLMNYRGHGAIQSWASPNLLSVNTTDFWMNIQNPLVILSADCLDGHFAWPGAPALSETFLRLQTVGSAAHWSSSGLGYTGEHTALVTHLYDGFFNNIFARVGDAAVYAKLQYDLAGYHESELYSFNLQGDPAMQVVPQYVPPPPVYFRIFLPMLQKPSN